MSDIADQPTRQLLKGVRSKLRAIGAEMVEDGTDNDGGQYEWWSLGPSVDGSFVDIKVTVSPP